MKKISFKKLVSVMALSMSLALTTPAMLPLANISNVSTVEAASLKISQKSASVLAGQSIKLTVENKGKKSIKWSTDKSKVATVKNGKVTALSKGTAVISAKVGKKTVKCKVTVKENKFTDTKIAVQEIPAGSMGISPYSVYYKDGKLFCKAEIVNRQSTRKVTKITNQSKKNQLKMSLTAHVLTSPTTYDSIEIASGTIKEGLPTNISYNDKKSFTVAFSSKQIKKKGFDLNTAAAITLDTEEFLIWSYR